MIVRIEIVIFHTTPFLQEETKNLLQVPGPWCNLEKCHLKIFQEGTEALMTSPDGECQQSLTLINNLTYLHICGIMIQQN